MLDLSLKIYKKYLDVVDYLHITLFEFRLKLLGYEIIDRSTYYCFHRNINNIYCSDFNLHYYFKDTVMLCTVNNMFYIDMDNFIFKFDINKNIITNYLNLDYNSDEIFTFLNNMRVGDIEYIKNKLTEYD